jgi:phosphate transport system substrate-binding protein
VTKKHKEKIMKNLLIIISLILVVASPLMAARNNQLTLSGSTTVLPIAQAAAEAFMDKHEVNVSVRGGGSGVGIAALMNKTVDIADASRPMKSKEITKAKSSGVNPTAYAIANDGITIVVNSQNTVKNLTLKDLKGIFTGKITNWNQLGGPNMPIVAVSRDVSSGTFEVFNEKVLAGAKVVDSAMMLASNNAVAATVGDTPGAIGYIGLGYVTDKTKIVSVENCIPTLQTIKSGEYKLSRKLYMYTNGPAKGNAAQFLNFIFSAEGQKIVEEQGFIAIK